MSKSLANKVAETVQSLRRDLAEVTDLVTDEPSFLDPLLREMREQIEAYERKRSAQLSARPAQAPTGKPTPATGIQKREVIIETLRLLRRPATPTVVARAALIAFGATIAPSQFASLRKGDERGYMRGRKIRTMLVPALSATDLTARSRTIALSDWEFERRVIGQWSERTDSLHIILRLLELQKAQPELDWSSVLKPLAQDFRFSTAPGDDLAKVSELVFKELERIEMKDIAERHEAAERASRLSEASRLFGAPILLENDKGTTV